MRFDNEEWVCQQGIELTLRCVICHDLWVMTLTVCRVVTGLVQTLYVSKRLKSLLNNLIVSCGLELHKLIDLTNF
jgi:hypothetical protein